MRKLLAVIMTFGLITTALVVGPATIRSSAADHLDGPLADADGRLDITDVYAFQSPKNHHNTVLIMNVDPGAGVLSPTTFHPDAAYDLKIDTDGDARPDITYQVRFSRPDHSGVQNVTLRRMPGSDSDEDKGESDDGVVLARGQTGRNIEVKGGGMLRAGLFDDPFFFDLAAFRNNLQFCPGGQGSDFFLGLNVASIVLEVPSSKLGTQIGVWGRTRLHGKQIDRMGRPAINTVFHNHNDPGKDAFNVGQPVHDQRDFRADVVNTLLALGNTQARANALADFLLPDILTVDTSSSAGFPNGRRLQDDVIDIELGLITNGAVTSDCVSNDSTFGGSFPYLGQPN